MTSSSDDISDGFVDISDTSSRRVTRLTKELLAVPVPPIVKKTPKKRKTTC